MVKYPTIGVSIPDKDLLAAAKAKAKAERRSLSNYICGLLEADLALEIAAELRDRAEAVENRMMQPATGQVTYKLARPSSKSASEAAGILGAAEASHDADPKPKRKR